MADRILAIFLRRKSFLIDNGATHIARDSICYELAVKSEFSWSLTTKMNGNWFSQDISDSIISDTLITLTALNCQLW